MKFDLPLADRHCGDCQACCFGLGVHEINKPMNQPCQHQCPTGCGIYNERPESCRTYQCMWLDGTVPGDERRRPDKLGVIFDRTCTDPRIVVCREARPGAIESEQVKYVIKWFTDRNKAVYCSYIDGKRAVHGPRWVHELFQQVQEVSIGGN